MIKYVNASEFLNLSAQYKIIDARSPSEFAQGHIPNAINIPIFDDEERKIVGIKYKQAGREGAVIKGLELIGHKLYKLILDAKKFSIDKTLLLHCWRGGMRSGSMAYLLNTCGINVFLLEKGYKAYRGLAHQCFESLNNLVILGGFTGSGKTEILEELKLYQQQIIDLERLANHKGSAFGALQTEKQPTTEQFENNLFQELRVLNINKPIWVEDESMDLGMVKIPAAIFKKMRHSPVINLKIKPDKRILKLVDEYGVIDKTLLIGAIHKITRKLGHLDAQNAIKYIENNELYNAAEILLRYYDKSYAYGLSQRNQQSISDVELPDTNTKNNTKLVFSFYNSFLNK